MDIDFSAKLGVSQSNTGKAPEKRALIDKSSIIQFDQMLRANDAQTTTNKHRAVAVEPLSAGVQPDSSSTTDQSAGTADSIKQ